MTNMKNLLEEMLKRDPNNYESYTEAVQNIVDQVKERGDEAVFAFKGRHSAGDAPENMHSVDHEAAQVSLRSMDNGPFRRTGTERQGSHKRRSGAGIEKLASVHEKAPVYGRKRKPEIGGFLVQKKTKARIR